MHQARWYAHIFFSSIRPAAGGGVRLRALKVIYGELYDDHPYPPHARHRAAGRHCRGRPVRHGAERRPIAARGVRHPDGRARATGPLGGGKRARDHRRLSEQGRQGRDDGGRGQEGGRHRAVHGALFRSGIRVDQRPGRPDDHAPLRPQAGGPHGAGSQGPGRPRLLQGNGGHRARPGFGHRALQMGQARRQRSGAEDVLCAGRARLELDGGIGAVPG